ncbi:MAG TPA: hypothetical protein P5096_03460 [Patescibacteria group bacterium]|nr:hypothetical protein [Patescibacteria group bacterium]
MIEVDTPHGKRKVMMIEEFNELKKETEKFLEEVENRKCDKCGGELMVTRVKYSLWDSPAQTAGCCAGRCLIIETPFCPKCEKEPTGCPVADKGSYHYITPEIAAI